MKAMSLHHNEPIVGLHPYLGFIVSIILMVASHYVHCLELLVEGISPQDGMRIPHIVLDTFQLIAFLSTTVMGGLAVYKFISEKKANKKSKSNGRQGNVR